MSRNLPRASLEPAPARPARVPARSSAVTAAPGWRSAAARLGSAKLYIALAGAALGLAALSLLIPSTPSYDPWSWLIWGRDIVHLDLHTAGGPSWKPLPVLFTTVFALFGNAQPDLWLVVARAGALMAVAMAFRLAYRLTRDLFELDPLATRRARVACMLPGLLAGLIAAGSLLDARAFITDNALGYSEGLAAALLLIALERLMDGAPRQSFVIGFFAALDRPELWFFWFPFGLYLWWKEPRSRTVVGGLFALIPVLWFGPELWGSGHLLRGLTRAQQLHPGSAVSTSCPVCTEFERQAWLSILNRVKVAGILALVLAGGWLLAKRGGVGSGTAARARAFLLAIGLFGFAWWVGIAVETQAEFSGNKRYLMLGTAAVAVVGGVAWGWIATGLAMLVRRLKRVRTFSPRLANPAVAFPAGTLLTIGLLLAIPPWIARNIVSPARIHDTLLYQAHLREDLVSAVRLAGGSASLLRCGTVMTETYQVPMVAWTLGVPMTRILGPREQVAGSAAPNVILQARAEPRSALLPSPRQIATWEIGGAHYVLAGHVRTFSVLSTCGRKVQGG